MNQNLTRYQMNGTSALDVDVRSGNQNNVIRFPGSTYQGVAVGDHSAARARLERRNARRAPKSLSERIMAPFAQVAYELFEGRLSGTRIANEATPIEAYGFIGFVTLTMAVSLVVGM